MSKVTIQFGIGNTISKEIADTGEIRSSWLEALGADPSRVEYVVNGRPYVGALAEGDTVEVRTKANEKGAVRISFGTGNTITRDFHHTDEISDSLIEALGADPERVDFYLNGRSYEGELDDGDEIILQTKANEKGC